MIAAETRSAETAESRQKSIRANLSNKTRNSFILIVLVLAEKFIRYGFPVDGWSQEFFGTCETNISRPDIRIEVTDSGS